MREGKVKIKNKITLDFLVFSDKDENPYVPSHSTFTYLVLVRSKRTHTTVRKE